MSEMIERVAKAIHSTCGIMIPFEAMLEPNKQILRMQAKAAIEAMREPTKAMENAGDELDDWGVPSDPGTGNASALAHWHAMINEALK